MIPGGIPTNEAKLKEFVQELAEQCNVSVSLRAAYYRMLNAIAETGRYDGTKSLINMMFVHLARTAALLFSPVELEFKLDFERPYPKDIQKKGAMTAKLLTRQWERNGTDMVFGRGVFEALKYGACILKQWPQLEGVKGKERPTYHRKLVMPWQFGVYREDENEIENQEVLCETTTLTLPEVWHRICMFDDAKKLFDRVKTHARKGNAENEPSSFFHQILSTNQLNTSGQQGLVRPGGMVNLQNDPVSAIMGPVLGVEVVQMRELWVKDEYDYVTLQFIEPDILLSGRFKHSNLLIKDSRQQPYRLIQPNEVSNWFWGRSELYDIIEPQQLLSTWADDAKRLLGVQIDKFLGFIGEAGLTDELYAQARMAGYIPLPQGSSITDLTPKFPPEMLPMLKWVIDIIDRLGGFPDILQGRGEQGVRAGVHADTLVKTGSPMLRDRALLVERQCATAADLTLTLMEAKDEMFYWTDGDDVKQMEETKFLISQLPEDWRVAVDSHKSSPIFADETGQLIVAGSKLGWVDGHYAIDNLPFPNKEAAMQALREKERKQQEMMAQLIKRDPEAAEKILAKQRGGGHR